MYFNIDNDSVIASAHSYKNIEKKTNIHDFQPKTKHVYILYLQNVSGVIQQFRKLPYFLLSKFPREKMDDLTKWENVIKSHAKKVQSETSKELMENPKNQVICV